MKRLSAVLPGFLLCGCVNLGQAGAHPQLKVAYFNGKPDRVADCLYSAALSQRLYLARDGRLPDGSARYNLQNSQHESVASVEVSPFSQDQTSVYFYHAKAEEIASAVAAMAGQCKDAG